MYSTMQYISQFLSTRSVVLLQQNDWIPCINLSNSKGFITSVAVQRMRLTKFALSFLELFSEVVLQLSLENVTSELNN